MKLYERITSWWERQHLLLPSDYATTLENFMYIYATNTSNIEGSHLTYHATRDIWETGIAMDEDDRYDVLNQRKAFEKMTELLCQGKPLSVSLTREIHGILMDKLYDQKRWDKGERPGDFKHHDYCIGLTSEGSAPEDVEEELRDLFVEVNDTTSTKLLRVAAYLHCRFETIHPFADGNGRMGRLLVNYYLMSRGHPPIIIFNENRDVYYMALEVYDRTEEISGMEKFFEEQCIKTWGTTVVTKEEVTKLRDLAPIVDKELPAHTLLMKYGFALE